MGTLREESSGNIHTIERQDVLMAQLCPTWQFIFESLTIGEGGMSKQRRDRLAKAEPYAPSLVT
jgi:hypothetical protein